MRKENQDTVHIALFPDDDDEDGEALVCAVLDGHGTSGRICALKTREWFAQELAQTKSKVMGSCLSGDKDALEVAASGLFNEAQAHIMDISEEQSKRVFGRFSGTTVTVVIVGKGKLCVLNAGDSEAVLGRTPSAVAHADSQKEPETPHIEHVVLSVKHQLDIPAERERIVKMGGRVAPKRGHDDGPLRVWLPDVETPGLMVSRSIGDGVCHDLGVSADPSIYLEPINPHDKFVIMASDGLWEFVDYEEAVNVVEDYVDPDDASHALVSIALMRQSKKNADNVSVIVILLETLNERRARLESQPGFVERHEKRFAKVQELEAQIRAQKQEAIDALKNNFGQSSPFVTSPPNGSILFGDPAEGGFNGGGLGAGGASSAIPTLDTGGLTGVSMPAGQGRQGQASARKSSMCILS
ncbi:Protein phosphatase, putative [Hondaea fermentalgiana]|uniref:Protein phosphatase, putative n=1 Tax=Hondaea fermentalgiana TaxID=2315210 RepID=A0A2R5GGL3_9STRA|nr:Protein phosphatase, putative [Hondaea fermentalgiana]|eukprot:GBG29479.1 Protein phosphatase, putative [Hondaea fermentalgiana]